jgi:hypothetical protein
MDLLADFGSWLSSWLGLFESNAPYLAGIAIAFAVVSGVECLIPAEHGQTWRGRRRNLLFMGLFFVLGWAALAFWFASPYAELPPAVFSPGTADRGIWKVLLWAVGYLALMDFL